MNQSIGIIGLAVMGRSLALNIADHGYKVAGYNRSYSVTEEMLKTYPHENFTGYEKLEDFVASLEKPRKILLMVKAGKPVDLLIEQLLPMLDKDDIVMDGGNSFYEDTIRREAYLKEKGVAYFGIGISGGEEGARKGPSMMPSGNKKAYEHIRPILESISAKAYDEKPCCAYIGENGAGHFVKMVHNGIEYADMQMIAEVYLLLKHIGGCSNEEMSNIFKQWNQGDLESFLIGITSDILKEKDDMGEGDLIDKIKDCSGQKGTGRWTSIEALKEGVDISMITASCNARVLSNHPQRSEMQSTYASICEQVKVENKKAFIEQVRQGMYAAKIIAYAQGFDLLQQASKTYEWNLQLGNIASIFRAGCIIQAKFLDDITKAYEEEVSHLLLHDFFKKHIKETHQALRRIVVLAISNGIPVPSLSNALAYLDMLSQPKMGASLIQAQRDYFGAHTYERIDQEGSFHHEWRK